MTNMKDNTLFNNLIHYGTILCDFSTTDDLLDEYRVRVFKLGDELYWVKQNNGDIEELQKIH